MSAGSYQIVKVSEIHLRDDVIKRTVSEEGVAKLVMSMGINGLQSAIRVRPLTVYKSGQPSQEWELVAGRHRLEAAKKLGWQGIDANVAYLSDNMAELAMIEENMARTDLEPAEFVYATARRKVLYEVEFPETKNGGDRGNQHTGGKVADRHNGELPDRFTKTAAEITGKGERTIQRAATAGKAIGSVAPRLVGTSLNSITELEALAKLEPETRKDLIKRAIAGEQVSAKAGKPKRAPNKDRRIPSNDNAPHAPIPVMDLTLSENRESVMAVGEAAAEAAFFSSSAAAGDAHQERGRDDHVVDAPVTLSSPVAEIAKAAGDAAVTQALEAFDEFLGRFAFLTKDQKAECLSRRDIGELITIYEEQKRGPHHPA
jgi:ParB family chromosome partitioning protein